MHPVHKTDISTKGQFLSKAALCGLDCSLQVKLASVRLGKSAHEVWNATMYAWFNQDKGLLEPPTWFQGINGEGKGDSSSGKP